MTEQSKVTSTFEGFTLPEPLDETLHPDAEYKEHFEWMQRLDPLEETLSEFASWQRKVWYVVDEVSRKWTEGKEHTSANQILYHEFRQKLQSFLESKHGFQPVIRKSVG